MKVMKMSTFWTILFAITLFSCLPSVTSQLPYDNYPTANLSTLWINNDNNLRAYTQSEDNSTFRIILRRGSTSGPDYACGFYCIETCDSYLFAIFILPTNTTAESWKVVWSANRNILVKINAVLELTTGGELVLRDADGTLAWSTNTGRSVVGLNLTEMGNLILFDAKNSVVWQSFDHPSDCLVPGQILVSGMKLTASASPTNWSTEGNSYSLSMKEQGLEASVQSDSSQPQVYYQKFYSYGRRNKKASYAKYQNGSLELYINQNEHQTPDTRVPFSQAISAQYMKLDSDAHLRVLEWVDHEWQNAADIFTDHIGECGYPMFCGKYGICSNGQCRCPNGTSFRQTSENHPEHGCSEVNPLVCNASENHNFLDLASKNHTFLDLYNVTYFAFMPEIVEIDMNRCKKACLEQCSCKAAIFRYSENSSRGECYIPSQMFSLMEYDRAKSNGTIYSASIKVLIAPTVTSPVVDRTPTAAKGNTSLSWLQPLLGSSLGVIGIAFVIGTTVFMYRRRRRKTEEVEEEYLDQVPGMPTRFSFEELATATDNFNKKLGEGGFGSVFEGSLHDGTRIAVKQLDGVGHIKKSFLAEVETIGSIHHINLVRLIGFCAEKSHRLLVYEYVCNGSLDRWIYCGSHETMLDWSYRRKIILDIAKGLTYLHEDCRQKIIHLDIKPQNILLDEHYNAKLADFGLSKLVDRNQSNVVTTMRGTPGYLAPEWLHAVITEKVDVYSFGVVILEVVCGKKIFEQSRPVQERHLPTVFMKKAEEGQWLDLVDKCCQDVESNVAQVKEMMQISAWCLQSDHEKRPSMSMVLKVLEGVVDVQNDIDYNLIPQYLISNIPEVSSEDATRQLPTLLSGPR